MVGALLGAVGFGYSSVDGPFVQTNGAGEVAAAAIVGAAVGAGAGALAGDRAVFEAAE